IVARAVAALAASLALPTLATAEAAKLAEAEGLVTHLTSLVLVDESGATQESVPASRKVPLATPATQAHARRTGITLACIDFPDEMAAFCMPARPASVGGRAQAEEPEAARRAVQDARRHFAEEERQRSEARGRVTSARGGSLLRRLAGGPAKLLGRDMLERSGEDLSRIARHMNWDFAPDRLQAGRAQGHAPAPAGGDPQWGGANRGAR